MAELNFKESLAKMGITDEQLKDADEGAVILELCKMQDADGDDYYVYLGVYPSKYEAYLSAEGTMNLADYGEILHKDWGTEPSEKVRQEMEEKYGVNHNFEAEIASELKQIQEKEQKNKVFIKSKEDIMAEIKRMKEQKND